MSEVSPPYLQLTDEELVEELKKRSVATRALLVEISRLLKEASDVG